MSDFADIDEDVLSALTARPAEERPWVAVRRALDPLIEHYDANSEQTLRVAKLFIGTPVLVAFHRENLVRWARLLKPELVRRMDADPRRSNRSSSRSSHRSCSRVS
jgi:hypothetical protein